MIFNGNMKGDEGEFTYTRRRRGYIIDYVIGDREVKEKIERLEIGERIESDHHPEIV